MTDFPRFVPVSAYDLAIDRMVGKLRRQDGVVSIFQIGSINAPGISDIDMLVVFEEDTRCCFNPLDDLSKMERYLFSHTLYGISRENFSKAHRYSFFHNYRLLWGEEPPLGKYDLSEEEIQILKTQIALEYLIKMFVNSTVELVYGIVRVRGILVLVKALSYDLEFLNVSSGRLFDLVQTIKDWRNSWFEGGPDKQTFRMWFLQFCAALKEFLEIELRERAFHLPELANVHIARNMVLEPSEAFCYTHAGLRLPAVFRGLGRKYFNVQHRFNAFRFRIPVATSEVPAFLQRRFAFVKEMNRTNRETLPYFMPLTSSLNIFS